MVLGMSQDTYFKNVKFQNIDFSQIVLEDLRLIDLLVIGGWGGGGRKFTSYAIRKVLE